MKGNWKSLLRSARVGLLGLAVAGLLLPGCSGDPTAPVTDTRAPADTAPPAVPTGLSAAAVNTKVKVAWLPNTTDPDFAGFMLYRLAFDQVWPLTAGPTFDTSYLDESPLSRPCRYAVTAVDADGNESAWRQVYFAGVPDRPDLDCR